MKKPTYQKVLMLSGLFSIALTNGLVFGQTTGLLNSLKKNEDGLNISEDHVMIIGSGLLFMSFFGYSLAMISDKMGRRWPLIISSVAILAHWIILYMAQNMLHFILSRIIAGLAFAVRFTLIILTVPEYTSPNTRAFFLNIITTVAPAIGTGLGHYLGNVYHWRTVAAIAIIPTLFGITLPYFCVESPHWLASKGRFQECEKSFRKLHRSNAKTESELQLLIKMEKCKMNRTDKINSRTARKKLFHALKKKYFWNLILIGGVISSYMAATGKVAFTILASIILEDITGSSNVLLYNTLVDVFDLVGACLSCVLVRKMTMRTMLFSTGYSANCVLVILSACLYFDFDFAYQRWVNVILLASYFILVETGPCPLLEALIGEIYPLEIKVYCFFLVGSMMAVFVTLSVILFPILSSVLGYYGIFLLNATIMTVCLTVIWMWLPETKGKTLQEIEIYFKTDMLDVEDALCDEKISMLL